MNKQELLSQKALYESHIAYKSETLREFKSKLKSIDRALQELTRGDQRDMFGEEDWGDLGVREEDWGFGNPKDETSMEHDLRVNEIDVMYELNG